jgi:hypothetical protein
VFLRGAEVFFAPQIRDFPPRFHARVSVFAYLCPAGPIGYPPMHGSSGDRAGGDDSPRRSFQIRLHVATCACITLVLPVGGPGGSVWWLYDVFRGCTCPWLVPHCWYWYLFCDGRKGGSPVQLLGGSIGALDVDCIDFGMAWRVLTKFARRVALYLLLLMLSIRKSRQREGLSWLELRRLVLIIDAVYWQIMSLLEECCASLQFASNGRYTGLQSTLNDQMRKGV